MPQHHSVEPGIRPVVEACVSLVRFFTMELALAIATRHRWLTAAVLRTKAFIDAQASINVPSTEKCSVDSSGLIAGSARIAVRKLQATSPSSRRIPIPVNTVTSHIGKCAPSPARRTSGNSMVVGDWLHQPPFRADREQRLQQQCTQQLGAIDGRPSCA